MRAGMRNRKFPWSGLMVRRAPRNHKHGLQHGSRVLPHRLLHFLPQKYRPLSSPGPNLSHLIRKLAKYLGRNEHLCRRLEMRDFTRREKNSGEDIVHKRAPPPKDDLRVRSTPAV